EVPLEPGGAHLERVAPGAETLEVEPSRDLLRRGGDRVEIHAAVAIHHHPEQSPAPRDLDQLKARGLDHRPDQRLNVHLALTVRSIPTTSPEKKVGRGPLRVVDSTLCKEYSAPDSLGALSRNARHQARRSRRPGEAIWPQDLSTATPGAPIRTERTGPTGVVRRVCQRGHACSGRSSIEGSTAGLCRGTTGPPPGGRRRSALR